MKKIGNYTNYQNAKIESIRKLIITAKISFVLVIKKQKAQNHHFRKFCAHAIFAKKGVYPTSTTTSLLCHNPCLVQNDMAVSFIFFLGTMLKPTSTWPAWLPNVPGGKVA